MVAKQLTTSVLIIYVYDYHHSTKLYRKISQVLLQVHSTSNNANGNKRVIFFLV